MKKEIILLTLVLAILIVGCIKQPVGEVTQIPEAPGIEDIVKETLPVAPIEEPEVIESEPEEKYLAKLTVNEGELVRLDLEASDPDGDKLTYKFSEPLDENGEWQTNIGDRGEYPIDVIVSDGKLESKSKILIIVKAVNRAPKITPPAEDIEVVEGQTVVLDLNADDPDGDKLTWIYSAPFSSEGVWETKFGDRGTTKASVSVSDGLASDSISLTIVVLPGDRPPVLKVPRELTFKEGDVVVIEPEVSDPDGDEVTVTYSGWMTKNTKETGFDDAGEYRVTVTASDGLMEESQIVKIIVENVNRPPEIKGIIVK